MTFLKFLAQFLEVLSNPLVLLAPLILSLTTGQRSAVRAGTLGLAALLGVLAAWGLRTWDAIGLVAVSCLAGGMIAEVFLSLCLPVGVEALRAVKRLRAWLRTEHSSSPAKKK